ncbi:MAG: glutathione S-transferase family protein [Immundisolibacteraceae bacterium]|nr:glutathione S-transferase family protein [Immundisolibacteraceae bacterium]
MSKLIGAALSPFVRKVRVYLDERGIGFESAHMVPGGDDPAFRKISPLGKIPAYQDDQVAVSDSSVIIAYLERRHGAALYPDDAVELARALWLEEYADSAQFDVFIAGIFFAQIVAPAMSGAGPDVAAIQASVDRLPEVFNYLETQIEGEFLVGDSLTIADISVVSPFVNLEYCGHPPNPAQWPKLANYVAGIMRRPGFRSALDAEAPLLQKMSGR